MPSLSLLIASNVEGMLNHLVYKTVGGL